LPRHLVLSLIGRDASVAELVPQSGLSMRTLHYQVVRLETLGLLKIASTTKRGGRPIKRYTAAAEAFFVPESLMTSSPGAMLDRELRDALGRAHADGTLFYRDSVGGMSMREVRTAPVDDRAIEDVWLILDLDEREAKQLSADIRKLLDEVRTRRAHRRHRKYLVRWALLPRSGDDLFSP
jgi:hypothetical protein